MKPVIEVANLSKAYRIGVKDEVPDSLVGAAMSLARRPLAGLRQLRRLDTHASADDASDVVWALKEVSFDVQEGEVVGIIGRNGAGKSTLLKILSRIVEPTRGCATLRGRVSSLLEVGTGFHPDLTGRENVYMNGTILGMTKREIDRKFDEIVEFSGVEKFLDTPVKRYSSGMTVRLAFAVAAHLEPEILIVDEVLAVGDAHFQSKCIMKMKEVAGGGRTVLIVSHNMLTMKHLCSHAVILNQGTVSCNGPAVAVLDEYLQSTLPQGVAPLRRLPGLNAVIERVEILNEQGIVGSSVRCGEDVCIRIQIARTCAIPKARIGIRIDSLLGGPLVHLQSEMASGELLELPAAGTIDCKLRRFALVPGRYAMVVALFSERRHIDHLEPALEFVVEPGDFFGTGCLPNSHLGQFLAASEWEVRSAFDDGIGVSAAGGAK